MSWKKKFSERIADLLRFAAYLFLALDTILLSVFLFWFLAKFLWRFMQYVDHHIFENQWF
jgi:hypothetical protein